jgi:alkanesulfonate monooxygenase SsuD/methylene tetrahydromethanopterin reductase-like flavin-dependent oxidoreductase (luciferase family)
MSGAAADPAIEADRFQAAIAMAEYADRNAFAIVNVEEHHDSEIGWLPSPLIMAALIASCTSRIQIRASALLVTLYDPLRLAEDIAILDLASRGRFVFIAGQGYRPSEYHMMDRDWDSRGKQMEFVIETLLKAWAGNPFDYRGRMVHVSPRPFTQPHPPFYYGGMSPVAVKRAARYGLPFFPAQPNAALEALYTAECARNGTTPHLVVHRDMALLFIDEDPDRAWAELGPYFLAETRQYSQWIKGGVERRYETQSDSIDALRAQGIFEILTPDDALSRALEATEEYKPILHPLAGGVPIDRAWRCLELYAERVLKRLPANRLA